MTHITDSDRKAGIGQRAEMKILDPKLPPVNDKSANSPTGSGGSGSGEFVIFFVTLQGIHTYWILIGRYI